MKYALNLDSDGRVLSVTYARYAAANSVLVEEIPEDDITQYIYVEGKLEFKPLAESEVEETPDRLDAIEAQLAYTAMMTDTLLEV